MQSSNHAFRPSAMAARKVLLLLRADLEFWVEPGAISHQALINPGTLNQELP
jgi:hypothetical protein